MTVPSCLYAVHEPAGMAGSRSTLRRIVPFETATAEGSPLEQLRIEDGW